MIGAAAAGWGRLIGRYGRKTVNLETVRFLSEPMVPDSPIIWVCWHEFNLIAIAVYAFLRKRPDTPSSPRAP